MRWHFSKFDTGWKMTSLSNIIDNALVIRELYWYEVIVLKILQFCGKLKK